MSSSGEQDHLLLTLQTNRKENGNRQLWLIGYQLTDICVGNGIGYTKQTNDNIISIVNSKAHGHNNRKHANI